MQGLGVMTSGGGEREKSRSKSVSTFVFYLIRAATRCANVTPRNVKRSLRTDKQTDYNLVEEEFFLLLLFLLSDWSRWRDVDRDLLTLDRWWLVRRRRRRRGRRDSRRPACYRDLQGIKIGKQGFKRSRMPTFF